MCPLALRKLRTYDFVFQTTPDAYPETQPPCRWPALITLPTLVMFHLVWRRLCEIVVLFPSCRVKHGLTETSLIIEYRFQVTRVAPSTLQPRSKGRPSRPPPYLASPLLPFLLRPLCRAPSFLPCLASSIPVPPTIKPFPIDPSPSIPRRPSCIPAARSSPVPKQATDSTNYHLILCLYLQKVVETPNHRFVWCTVCVNYFLEALLQNYMCKYIHTTCYSTTVLPMFFY